MKTFAKVKEVLARRNKINKAYRAIESLTPRQLEDMGFDPYRVSMGKAGFPWK